MIVLGLTGSIGMGKSTTATYFAEQGIPVYSADEAVHTLYQKEAVMALIEATFPNVVTAGLLDREALSRHLVTNEAAIGQLEAIIHPLLRVEEENFLAMAQQQGQKIVVLDIPLLYETGADQRVNYVAVVSAPASQQRQRVLAREGMNIAKFNILSARQMPDAEKKQRADFLINTGEGFEKTRQQVKELLQNLEQLSCKCETVSRTKNYGENK